MNRLDRADLDESRRAPPDAVVKAGMVVQAACGRLGPRPIGTLNFMHQVANDLELTPPI